MPAAARVELERLGARWRTLPLPQALRHAPTLRGLAARYAAECAGRPGAHDAPVIPDLGPAAAYDQLVTLTYDVARHRGPAGRAALAGELAELRREIG